MSNAKKPAAIETVDELIEVLGGPKPAAEKLELKSSSAILNWKTRGIPPGRFIQIRKLLADLGREINESLFFEKETA